MTRQSQTLRFQSQASICFEHLKKSVKEISLQNFATFIVEFNVFSLISTVSNFFQNECNEFSAKLKYICSIGVAIDSDVK